MLGFLVQNKIYRIIVGNAALIVPQIIFTSTDNMIFLPRNMIKSTYQDPLLLGDAESSILCDTKKVQLLT